MGISSVMEFALESEEIRHLQSGNNSTDNSGDNAYEFVAFLLWYIFLVLCCVVPTCCAYRRRRLLETRLAQQHVNNLRLQQQQSNLFILSNFHSRHQNSEFLRRERSRLLTEELTETTLVLTSDLIQEVEDFEQPASSSIPQPSTAEDAEGSSRQITDYSDLLEDPENTSVVHLPADKLHGNRAVSGFCAICLCRYEAGDRLTWSPEQQCLHAFHTDCIVPWLAKKDEPKCPVCRQNFCPVVTVQDEPQSDEANEGLPSPFIFGPFSQVLPVFGFTRRETVDAVAESTDPVSSANMPESSQQQARTEMQEVDLESPHSNASAERDSIPSAGEAPSNQENGGTSTNDIINDGGQR